MQNFVADISQRDTVIKHDGRDMTIHSVEVLDSGSDTALKPPLVFLPGYGTGQRSLYDAGHNSYSGKGFH